jgi:hypothetical protein
MRSTNAGHCVKSRGMNAPVCCAAAMSGRRKETYGERRCQTLRFGNQCLITMRYSRNLKLFIEAIPFSRKLLIVRAADWLNLLFAEEQKWTANASRKKTLLMQKSFPMLRLGTMI